MRPETAEWVDKAEGDHLTARREGTADHPNPDAACYHAQQCAEKYPKARLVEAGVAFRRTHDLEVLLDVVLPLEPAWEAMREPLRDLSLLAIEVRYSGRTADAEDVAEALATVQRVREGARAALGLPA